MTNVVPHTEFHGRWLCAEFKRVHEQLRKQQGMFYEALEVLDSCGIDPRDRRAVKRTLGGADEGTCDVVPMCCRGNRAAYDAFIDGCVEIHKDYWRRQGWL